MRHDCGFPNQIWFSPIRYVRVLIYAASDADEDASTPVIWW